MLITTRSKSRPGMTESTVRLVLRAVSTMSIFRSQLGLLGLSEFDRLLGMDAHHNQIKIATGDDRIDGAFGAQGSFDHEHFPISTRPSWLERVRPSPGDGCSSQPDQNRDRG